MLDARQSHPQKRNNNRISDFGVFGALHHVHPLAFTRHLASAHFSQHFQLTLAF
jgi:hypothetical protein